MATIFHIVEKGDTLESIANKYGVHKYDIARLNNLTITNYICVGQKLIISGGTSSGSTYYNVNYNDVKITQFGLLATPEDTMFVSWEWYRSNTSHYDIKWLYDIGNNTWFIGKQERISEPVYEKISMYEIPAKAKRVKVCITPYSYTYYPYGITTSYWTVNGYYSDIYIVNNEPLITPPVPSVSIKGYNLTARVDNHNSGNEIQFQIIQNDEKIYKTGVSSIISNSASFSCSILDGYVYKVRCRSKKYDTYSEWSECSTEYSTKPNTPTNIDWYANSETSIMIFWNESVSAEKYTIQYSTDTNGFNQSDGYIEINDINNTIYEITGLEKSKVYYFRVKALNVNGVSGWSTIKSGITGSTPAPPTTWSPTTGKIGDRIEIFWIHNSKDNSKERQVEIELTINGVVEAIELDGNNTTGTKHSYTLDSTSYPDKTRIEWRVRTKGIVDEWSEWSIKRSIDMCIPPTLVINMVDSNDDIITTLTSFPFYVKSQTGPTTQSPISYNVTITADESYQYLDGFGDTKNISKGTKVFSRVFNTSEELNLSITPASVNLENNISYTISCVVTMDSGLQAEDTISFEVKLYNFLCSPNAEIMFDPKTVSTNIRPYCDMYPFIYYRVEYDPLTGIHRRTNDILTDVTGVSINGEYTEEYNDIVYMDTSRSNLFFCEVRSEKPELLDNITLSVYRKEYDGRFVEIGTGIINTEKTFVSDPHPTLGNVYYRIIAVNDISGEVSFSDIPAYPINERAIVIQWDEVWSELKPTEESSELETRSWNGSMLKLPYNIDVSDSNSLDVNLVNYIGRSHPVAYYGTQLGLSSTWNVDIPKNDEDTLYALRRLMLYRGDVYVREPSGSGYWANISISFSQKHCEMVIPVQLEITRVEGGI